MTSIPQASSSARRASVAVRAEGKSGSSATRPQVSQADLERIPCPVLRAGVASGFLTPNADGRVSLAEVGAFVGKVTGTPAAAGAAIAAVANGALATFGNVGRRSFDILNLKNGPIMKTGSDGQPAGSRIFELATGKVNEEALGRMDREFAKDFRRPDGTTERGYDAEAIARFREANQARSGNGFKNKLFSALEFPPLEKAAAGEKGYLSHEEVRALFADQQLPAALLEKLSR